MALGTLTLKDASGAAAASTTSASFTPTANALLIVLAVARRGSSTNPNAHTISDTAGLTWTNKTSATYPPSGTTRGRATLFTAVVGGSPAAMTVTVTSTSSTATEIVVAEITGADTASLANFISGGVANAATLTLLLPSAPAANSTVVTGVGGINTGGITSPGAFTEITDAGTTSERMMCYDAGSAAQTNDWTAFSGGGGGWSIEIVEATTGSAAAAAGTSTVTSEGNSTAASPASSTGTSTTPGVGAGIAAAVGSSTGTSTAAATSPAAGSVAASAGTSTAPGVGAGIAAAVASSAGTSTTPGVGASVAASPGSSAGTSTTPGVGAGITAAVGSSAGTSTTPGVGKSNAASPGSSAGTSTTSGVSASIAAAVGSSAGTSTATGAVSASNAPAVGSSAGSSVATAAAQGLGKGAAATAGTGVATGVGRALAASLAASTALSTVLAASIVASASIGLSTGLGLGTATGSGGGYQARLYLTAGTTFNVPPDWNSSSNMVEIVAPGGAGCGIASGKAASGGGGAYSKKLNITLTPGGTAAYSAGTPGLGVSGTIGSASTDAWFNGTSLASASVSAEAGKSATATTVFGPGGKAVNGIGDVKFDGGDGLYNGALVSGYGGGGAAGPFGAGETPTTPAGGQGDNTHGGAGGPSNVTPQNGSPGTEWDGSHGSGGGGGGTSSLSNTPAGDGGLYGGGGAGVRCSSAVRGGNGGAGLIIVQYNPIPGVAASAGTSAVTAASRFANLAATAGMSTVTSVGKALFSAIASGAGDSGASMVSAKLVAVGGNAAGTSTVNAAGRKDVVLVAASGAYNWLGNDATLQHIVYKLQADHGMYTMQGQTLRLFKSSFITADGEIILVLPENSTVLVPEEPREIRLRPGEPAVEDGEEYRVVVPPNRQRLQ